jgi:hypothetical protein
MKWKELAVNRMLLVMITRLTNTFFMIVQRKVLMATEMFVTTVYVKISGLMEKLDQTTNGKSLLFYNKNLSGESGFTYSMP